MIREQENTNLVESSLYWPAAMKPQRSKALEATGDLLSESGSKKGTVVSGNQSAVITGHKIIYENVAIGRPRKPSLHLSGQQLQRQTASSLQTATRLQNRHQGN